MRLSYRVSLLLMSLALLAVSCDSNTSRIQSESDAAIFQPRSASHGLGLRGTKTVALTFDDGPNAKATGELLDYLKQENIKATFFLIGNNAKAHPELVARIRDEGHTIGNHSMTHPNMPSIGRADINRVYREIKDADDVIEPFLLPSNRHYFRPPEGAWAEFESTAMNQHADLRKYIGPVKWDVGGRNVYGDANGKAVVGHTDNLIAAADWECWSRKVPVGICAAGYYKEIQSILGGIVLMHDRAETPTLVKVLLPALRAQGYKFVRLDDIQEMEQFQ